MTATEQVILVDLNDNPIGTAEKLEAHRKNLCHRAFSVFILRKTKTWEILLQQRAQDKYHSPNLWTNTCCSHPRPSEDILTAAKRRLYEEMGIETSLSSIGWFHYIAHFPNGLTENEIDHVLIGTLSDNQSMNLNPEEVQQAQWISLSDLKNELDQSPEKFTPWISQALGIVENYLKNGNVE